MKGIHLDNGRSGELPAESAVIDTEVRDADRP